jgi:hypothetical protein
VTRQRINPDHRVRTMNCDGKAQERQLFELATKGGYTEFKQLIGLLRRLNVNWCLIGDAAVNAYVEPIYMVDVHFVVTEISEELRNFTAKALRVQFSTDPVYRCFISRSEIRGVFGEQVPVACLRDLVSSKIDAWKSVTRKAWKRSKDEADLLRLTEGYPEITSLLPDELRGKLN